MPRRWRGREGREGGRQNARNVRARFSGQVTVSVCKANEIFAGSHCGRVRERAEVPDARRIGCTCTRARWGCRPARARKNGIPRWTINMGLYVHGHFSRLFRAPHTCNLYARTRSHSGCDNSGTVLSFQNPCNKPARGAARGENAERISEYNASCIDESRN